MPDSNSNIALEKSPDRLIKAISQIINKVVRRYISRGVIPEREKEDTEMSVMEKFLKKKDKINSSFKGTAQITTYYTAVINRMCCEVIRKDQKHWYAVKETEEQDVDFSTLHFDTAKRSLLLEELKRFKHSLILFNGSYAKVLLFLKYYFDIPIQTSDIESYAKGFESEASLLLSERSNLSKAEVNDKLAQLVSLVENKSIGGDAVRMWINKQIETILCRLNGNNHSFHTKETISVMLEMIYTKN